MSENPSKITFLSIIEWHTLKKTFIVFIMSFLLCIACVSGGRFYYTQQEESTKDLQRELITLNKRLEQAKEASKIVHGRHLEMYEDFIKRGFFLKEYNAMEEDIQRAQLSEKIATLIKKLEFPPTETDFYQLDEQERYQIPHLDLTSDYAVYVAPLTLQSGILHEGDVLRLLDAIEFQNIFGLLNVQRCRVERLREINIEDVSKPYFKMSCVLLWYTSRLEENT